MTVKELNQADFEKAINAKEVVIVDFFAEWCGPCKTLKPILEEVSAQGITVYSVNVDENKELASKFQISSIPAVLYFKDGKKVDEFVGIKDTDDIVAMAKKH